MNSQSQFFHIGDSEGRATFCTCEATGEERNLAKAAPDIPKVLEPGEDVLSEPTRLSMTGRLPSAP
jgi:hypothetical protein